MEFLDTLEASFRDPETRFDSAQRFLSLEDTSVATHGIFLAVLQSLLLDTDNTLFPVCLRCFLAVIPFAPQAITPHVPLIMIILGRAASWRDRPFGERKEGCTRTFQPNPTLEWSQVAPVPSTTLPDTMQPRNITRLLFVAVYNAWPSNVLAFLRDPVSYINGKGIAPVYNVPLEEVWEPGLLARRSAPLLRDFHLHPWLVYFTSTSELADEKRWEKIDAAEFITKSHMLAHSELLAGDKPDSLRGDCDDAGDLNSEAIDDMPIINHATDLDIRPTSPSSLQRQVELLRLDARFTDRIRKQYLHRERFLDRADETSAGCTSIRYNSTLTRRRSTAL